MERRQGTGYDQLEVSGAADLAGSLTVTPGASYDDPTTRGDTDELVVVVASAVSGSFDTIEYDGATLSHRNKLRRHEPEW